MGFLRKVGKKIKKGVKKLMGSKLGKIIGGIGLAMTFWGGANALFGNTKWFQGLKTNINKINPFAKGDVTSAVDAVVSPSDIAGPTLEGQIAQGKEILSPSFRDLPIGDKIRVAGEKTKDFLLPDTDSFRDFASDATRQIGMQYAMGAIEGEPEEEFYSRGVQPVGSMEGPQSAYMAEIQTQMPNLQATNFNQLNQSLFYGTLSPQYLMGQMG